MMNQKFDSHTQKRRLGKEVQSGGDERNRERTQQQGENLHQYSDQQQDWQSKPKEPFCGWGVEGNHILVEPHSDPVEQKRAIDRELRIDHRRKNQHK